MIKARKILEGIRKIAGEEQNAYHDPRILRIRASLDAAEKNAELRTHGITSKNAQIAPQAAPVSAGAEHKETPSETDILRMSVEENRKLVELLSAMSEDKDAKSKDSGKSSAKEETALLCKEISAIRKELYDLKESFDAEKRMAAMRQEPPKIKSEKNALERLRKMLPSSKVDLNDLMTRLEAVKQMEEASEEQN